MDLAQATGTPETVTLAGKEYNVRLLTMREWAVIQMFIKREIPSPVTRVGVAVQQAKRDGTPFDADVIDALYARAEAAALHWPPRLGTAEWFDALNMVDGSEGKVLFEVLSRTDPAFTLEAADKLAPGVTTDEWGELFRVALYGTHPRPKDEAGGSPPSPTGTTGTA